MRERRLFVFTIKRTIHSPYSLTFNSPYSLTFIFFTETIRRLTPAGQGQGSSTFGINTLKPVMILHSSLPTVQSDEISFTSLDSAGTPRGAALSVWAEGGGSQAGQGAAVILRAGVVIKQRPAADLSGFLTRVHTEDRWMRSGRRSHTSHALHHIAN